MLSVREIRPFSSLVDNIRNIQGIYIQKVAFFFFLDCANLPIRLVCLEGPSLISIRASIQRKTSLHGIRHPHTIRSTKLHQMYQWIVSLLKQSRRYSTNSKFCFILLHLSAQSDQQEKFPTAFIETANYSLKQTLPLFTQTHKCFITITD